MSGKYTLDTFYKSNAWYKLLQVIKSERINDDGDIVCEYCGEPIVRAYDCIGHHVIELDDSNVNDAEISLNPKLIQLVHHKCHNRIHNKFQYGASMRHVYLVYGSPLSGKTTWVNDVKNEGDLIVDIDSIWQCVSGCDRYVKPKVLNACVFSVRDCLLDAVKYRRGKWLNAYVIGGYPLISERERLCRELGAEEIFIDTSRDECLRRLAACNDGRNIGEWTGYVIDWWKRYAPRVY